MKQENKVPLLAIAILIVLLILLTTCARTNQVFILNPVKTYPEERNVLVAVPIIPVEIKIIE